ncbi:uncharacterized protein [Rutidosis leptorrhynchoides]|uniref:uncharacterized protein n=1 Tax=Rutidosis leptorrhynchoides TaxID=125765 RepID=UPI003A9A638E
MQLTEKKNYARVREEIKGNEPTCVEMFEECFSKGGETKCTAAKNVIEKMSQLRSKPLDGTIVEPGPDDLFSKVKGNNISYLLLEAENKRLREEREELLAGKNRTTNDSTLPNSSPIPPVQANQPITTVAVNQPRPLRKD